MSLKNGRLWIFSRKAQTLFVALLAMVVVGGSLFYVTAQRSSTGFASNQMLPRQMFAQQTFTRESESQASTGALVPANPAFFQDFYCASDDGRRHYCNADTRNGVRLVRQRSGTACVQGRTWGYDRRGVWVDRGCRADFAVGDRGYGRDRDNGRDNGRDNNRDRDRGRNVQTFYCESGDEKRHWCSEGIGGTVRLIRQRSGSPCIEGRTWGRDRSGVWVDRGCRADFEVRR